MRTYWPGEESEHMGIGFAKAWKFSRGLGYAINSEMTCEELRNALTQIIADYLDMDPEEVDSPDCTEPLDDIDTVGIFELVEGDLQTNELPFIDGFGGTPRDLMDVLCQIILLPEVSLAAVIADMGAEKKEAESGDQMEPRQANGQTPPDAPQENLINRKAYSDDRCVSY